MSNMCLRLIKTFKFITRIMALYKPIFEKNSYTLWKLVLTKMVVKSLSKNFKKSFKTRKYNNIVEALYVSKFIGIFCGLAVFVLHLTPDKRLVRKFSLVGLIFFLFWCAIYIYSIYKAHGEDQTILRNIYSTKVRRYGDDYEIILSILYTIFAMCNTYSLTNNVVFVEIIVDVDKALEGLGEMIDYNRDAHSLFIMSIGQVVIFLVRLISVWISLSRLNAPVAKERLFQALFSNAFALILITHFYFFLMVIKCRYKYVNKVLEEIKSHKSWEYKLFVRGQITANAQKAIGLQDRFICEKIRACAKIYGMMYKTTDSTNKKFGIILAVTMFISITYIILYMFYFMEATAASLFHDVERYVILIIYVFWEIAYAIMITLMVVFVSECAVYEAQNTSFILHEIINSDFSPSVTTEAMQFSMQCLHQKPIFTAAGLFELNNALLHQLARSVATYLIILLQFVTDSK